jgi:4,5-DOPA dioxygenase extradiol
MSNDMAHPVVFLGHGNPMNALGRNSFTKGWAALGARLPRPKAILMISAHWFIDELAVTAMQTPKTIHDFGGFPKELFETKYPAPGCPELAQEWGLDHGAWTVLRHVYPDASMPVVQLSVDRSKTPQYHFELGKKLSDLRDEGILVVGSGNIVHNLRSYAWGQSHVEPFSWAEEFDGFVREHLDSGDIEPLIDYPALGDEAKMAIPTPDHYLPFLTVLGAKRAGDKVSYPVEGFDGGSMSMLACMWK